jgi:thioredoxin-like negative regulator of GroEL
MRRTVLAGILAAPLIVAAGVLLLVLRRQPSVDADLRTLLSGLDAAIAGGYLSTARDTIASLRSLPSTEEGQLSLLKRGYQVSRGTGDFALLADLAGRALAMNGRSERIRAIAAYGNLRCGQLSEAEKSLARNAGAGSAAESLRGEALLRRGARWSGSDELTRELLSLEGTVDPAGFAGAALRAGDKRLSLDAALLAMQQGSTEAALRLVRSDLEESRFDEAAGLMLYDSGDLGAAAARMQRLNADRPGNPAVGMQLADINAAAGNDADSEQWLLRTLPLAPAMSWTPYADLALFALRRRDTAAAARRLDDGLAFFPRSRELRLMQARLDILRGDARAAELLLTRLLADRPSDGAAALMLLALKSPELFPEASRGRLWKLFDVAPTDPAVFDALASSLIAARDWEGMQIALRHYEASGGQLDSRLLLFQGFAAAMSGDDAGATAAFRRSSLLSRDGIARFNLALVMLRRGAARAALAELDGAAEEVQQHPSPGNPPPAAQNPPPAAIMSRIETLRGAARLLDGDLPGAGTALSHALSLDPHNLRAGLLLRKLEAGGQ